MKKLILCFVMILSISYYVTAQEKPIITVLDFQTNNVSEKDMQSIISLLSSAIFKTGEYRVIDVAQRQTILEELEFSGSDCTDESCQLEIGKLLSAQMIVVGNIGKVGTRFLMSSKILETETANTLNSADGVYSDMDALLDDIYNFASTLTQKKIEVSEAEPEIKEKPKKERAPVNIKRIAAFSCLGAGAAAVGVGTYFIINAISFRTNTVDPSFNAYMSATEGDEDYFTGLYNIYLDNMARYKTKALLGACFAGGGLLLAGTSIVLFLLPDKTPDDKNNISLMIKPGINRTALSLSIRY